MTLSVMSTSYAPNVAAGIQKTTTASVTALASLQSLILVVFQSWKEVSIMSI